jgi:hypothetical protein
MINKLVAIFENMAHDELRDFIDYAEFYLLSKFVPDANEGRFLKSVRARRSGLASGGLPYQGVQLAKNPLRMTTSRQREALKLLKRLEREWFMVLFGDPSEDGDRTLGAVAWALLRAKAPVTKGSEGNITVKWISYKRKLREPDGTVSLDKSGKPIIVTFAQPYLYLRYWQVLGDTDRKTRKKKSMYIGGHLQGIAERLEGGYMFRPLAELVWNTLQEHRAENGRRSPNPNSPIAQLEAQIMAFVDMSKNPPFIDEVKLLDLQDELCGEDEA